MNILKLIKETRTSVGKGTEQGRAKGLNSKGKGHTKATKSRAVIYPSITTALSRGYIGQIFSTPNSDRLYVITIQKWGQDDEQMVGGRTAKGFATGTPFKKVKKYAMRTLIRHGKQNSKTLKDRYLGRGSEKI